MELCTPLPTPVPAPAPTPNPTPQPQRHAFSAGDYADCTSRLEVLERLMRSQRARSSEELLGAVEAAAERLERYYDAEGGGVGGLGVGLARAETASEPIVPRVHMIAAGAQIPEV